MIRFVYKNLYMIQWYYLKEINWGFSADQYCNLCISCYWCPFCFYILMFENPINVFMQKEGFAYSILRNIGKTEYMVCNNNVITFRPWCESMHNFQQSSLLIIFCSGQYFICKRNIECGKKIVCTTFSGFQ